MLTDSRKGIQLVYNVLNLPVKVLSGGSVLAQYEYLVDGTKLSAVSGNGVGYKYRGNFLYSVDASGNETLESIGCDEGRVVITYSSTGVPTYKDYWQVKDHLGSVRAVYDLSTTGTIDSREKELSDYQPLGTRVERLSTPYNHWRFSGKEEQKIDGTDIGLLDFGARYYDPWLARWTTQDPLAHKYAGINPYVYCNGDPVNLVDEDGRDIWVIGENGEVVSRTKDTSQDSFILTKQDENGDPLKVSFAYKTFQRVSFDSSEPLTAFASSSEKSSAGLFKFLADNLGVEFGLITTQKDLNYVVSQHKKSEIALHAIARALDSRGNTITSITHNHPNDSAPSGFGKGDTAGDKFVAQDFPTSHGYSISYYVYNRKFSGLIEYTGTGIIKGIIPWELIFSQ